MTVKAQINKKTAEQNKEQPVSRTKQNTITDVFVSVMPYDKSSQRCKEITNSMMHCLARDLMPIYTVSKVGY